MKYVLIIWLCINDPGIDVADRCQQLTVDQEPYATLYECQARAHYLWKDLQAAGNIYMSSFCTGQL